MTNLIYPALTLLSILAPVPNLDTSINKLTDYLFKKFQKIAKINSGPLKFTFLHLQ